MKSNPRGKNTSKVEVSNVTPHGFWLLIEGRELYLPFKEFPWFNDASIREIADVDLPSPDHLYWRTLDIDLSVDSILHPEKYPLVCSTPTRIKNRSRR